MIDLIERDESNVGVRREKIDGLGHPSGGKDFDVGIQFHDVLGPLVGRGKAEIVSDGNTLILREEKQLGNDAAIHASAKEFHGTVARAVVHDDQLVARIARRFQEGGKRGLQVREPIIVQHDDRSLGARRIRAADSLSQRTICKRNVNRGAAHLSGS